MLKIRSIRESIAFLFLPITLACLNCAPVIASEEEQIKALMTEYGAGQYDAAFNRCVAILRTNSTNMTAHYFMGNLYLKYNKLDEAAAEYKYCVSAGPDAPESQAAQQGLQAVEQHRAAATTAATASSESPAVDAKVQEQIDRLHQEADQQIALRKKIFDSNVGIANQEMRDQIPRYIVGGIQGSLAWRETQQELTKEKQGKIDRYTKQFEREKQDINTACEKRVNDLIETQKNIQKRKAAGH
jgi:tetratricopeptide (TPR) repeat protein